MTPRDTTAPPVSRRSVLTLLAAAGLTAACSPHGTDPAVAAPASGSRSTAGRPGLDDALRDLERSRSLTVGVSVRGGGRADYGYRAAERFPMCSLFKPIAVGALLADKAYDDAYWSREIAFGPEDLVENSPVTSATTTWRMTPAQLADAALRFSDNTAGNLVLREIGGPTAVTSFAASLGARATRLDRIEPQLNEATPGDDRDTSTPDDVARIYGALLLERGAGALTAARLGDWMLRSTTSGKRFRAGLDGTYELADKTGAGGYGVVNDAGVLWRPGVEPTTLVVMTRTDSPGATWDDEAVAAITRLVVAS